MKRLTCLVILSVGCCSFSCIHSGIIPYAITEPVCVLGSFDAVHSFAGIHFSFYNKADISVSHFSLVCSVYTQDGDNPFSGTNRICIEYSDPIFENDSADIGFSLDDYIHTIPEEEYLIDNYYIQQITYTDGTVWKNTLR